MPEITPLPAPNADVWWPTYRAVLTGILAGLVQWAARGVTPITDDKVDEFVIRAQGVATRAANRVHGVLTVGGGPATQAPSTDGWIGDFLG